MLGFVWQAYQQLDLDRPPALDPNDVERSITEHLERRIHARMQGDEPFYVQHGPYERETREPPPAQPPQYDIAFVASADERVMWPLEAKVLPTDGATADYVRDIVNEFLTCRYAPFSSEGAMLGYLLSGRAQNTFRALRSRLHTRLQIVRRFSSFQHRLSRHKRIVPNGKCYPARFSCHHLIMPFPALGQQRELLLT